MTNISELTPFQKKVDLVFKVIEKMEIKEVTSKIDNSTHKVAEARVGDATGHVLITLWDDMIEKLETEKCYKLTNGFTSLFQNTIRVNIGKYGTIEASEENITVNMEMNASEKQYERRPRFGGGGGGGYGGGGGGYRGGGGGGYGGGGGGYGGGGGGYRGGGGGGYGGGGRGGGGGYRGGGDRGRGRERKERSDSHEAENYGEDNADY